MAIERALIIDDSRLARLTLSKLLRARNIEVIEAESVKEGFEKLETNTPDAIFMDVMMPEVDGFEGIEILKKDSRYASIPCAMYSGDLSVDSQRRAISIGAQAYLFKPANDESLIHVLAALDSSNVREKLQKAGVAVNSDIEPTEASHELVDVLERRTKNLAKIVMHERRQNESEKVNLRAEIEKLQESFDSLTKIRGDKDEGRLERLRVENDLKGQLKTTQNILKTVAILAICSFIVAFLSLIIVFFLE